MLEHPRRALAACLLLTTAALAAAPDTQPARSPNQLKLMSDAYKGLKSLSLSGTIDMSADIGGQKSERHAEFMDAYTAPIRFRHEVRRDVIAAVTADKAYVYLPAYNLYSTDDAPADGGRFAGLTDETQQLLLTQDMSLAFALSDNPSADVMDGATDIAAAADVTIDGRNYPAMTVSWADRDMTLVMDPATHLLRRVVIDQSRGLKTRGADVASAMVTINYTQTKVNAAITPAELAFVPPPTAQEREATAGNPMDLVGKRAPHFRLTKQDGGEVTDASLRGGAYVLVFWASWSDPSVSELPGLDDIYLKNITSAIKFFAVNQAEEAAAVKAFLSKSHITMPVLLDPEGKADIAFAAESLPEIVIVGRDGVVKKVFVGPDHQPDITAAIDALPGNAAAQPNP